jgi:Rieske Fe-S protein
MTDTASDQQTDRSLDRRRVLGVAAAAGLGAPLLAACGQNSDATSDTSASASSTPTAGNTASAGGSGGQLVATSAVPLDGGVVIQDKKIVVTQPTKGDFKAFTAVCTHMGCIVNQVSDNTIMCPCHGSQYSAEDGSVKGGPAPRPLAPVNIKVKGGEITTA